MRPYQREAVESFWHGGSGVVVLPCGAGKTLVGAAAMAEAKATTLILVTNTVSARQWKDELIRRTSLTAEEIGEYCGSVKEVRPVTIATYQVMTTKRKGVYPHLELLDARDWGLIVYDEVHLLPGTDLPDDGQPPGPPPPRPDRDAGARGRPRGRRVLADRAEAVRRPLEGHRVAGLDRPGGLRRGPGHDEPVRAAGVRDGRARGAVPPRVLHAGEDAGRGACWWSSTPASRPWSSGSTSTSSTSSAADLDAPVIKGETPVKERQRLFEAFRSGEITLLVVSKVANFSIDLPEAAVAIQVSGSFGSRQEEAQRLGRLLRPKADGRTARFYAVVARDTRRRRLRPEPPAVPRRAGLRLPDHRRRRPVRLRLQTSRRNRPSQTALP